MERSEDYRGDELPLLIIPALDWRLLILKEHRHSFE